MEDHIRPLEYFVMIKHKINVLVYHIIADIMGENIYLIIFSFRWQNKCRGEIK